MATSVRQAQATPKDRDGDWRNLEGRAREVAEDATVLAEGAQGIASGPNQRPADLGAQDSTAKLPMAVILSGGRGTRLQEHTRWIPKPLVEIGGRPIVWHVIQIYLAQGFQRFLLLTGYKSKLVDAFVDHEPWPDGVEVCCLDTGEDTPTGGRLAKAASSIADDTFCVTYADGVADIDLEALLACHAAHDALATMTVVQPELQFGVAVMSGDGVIS